MTACRRYVLRYPTVATCFLLLFALGCGGGDLADPVDAASGGPAAQQQGAAPETESFVAAESLVPQPLAEGDIPLVPADGRWAQDEDGNSFFLAAVPKIEGRYMLETIENEEWVRLPYGLRLRLAGQDESSFFARIVKLAPANMPTVQRRSLTEEERQAVAASYEIELPDGGELPLAPFDRGLPRRGQWRNGFAVADMNEDGHLDLVHGQPRKGLNGPAVFLGDGAGGWREWSEARFPGDLAYDYGDAVVADFDRDGHQDVALAMHVRGIVVMLGDGKGGFRAATEGLDYRREGTGFSSRSLAVLDLDQDGWPDLAALGEGMTLRASSDAPGQGSASAGIAFYRNRRDGTWERHATAVAPGVHGDALTVADFDGDGRSDLALSASVVGYRQLVLLAGGDGSWRPVELDLRPRAFTRAVAVGDLDGDGRPDLAVSYVTQEGGQPRSGIDLFLSRVGPQGLTWERRPLTAMPGRAAFTAIAIGELDGGGGTDLAALTGGGELRLFSGIGPGQFARLTDPSLLPALRGCSGYALEVVDLDGDGRGELVGSFAGEEGSDALIRRTMDSGSFADRLCPGEGALAAWKPGPTSTGPDRGR